MKIRKGKAAKFLAMILSICITGAFLPIAVSATESNNASISVTFRQGSEANGWIEIYSGTEWTTYNGSGAENAEAVRIRTKADYSVDWTGISLKANGADILTDDIRNQLTNDSGYTLTQGTQYALENVEFSQGNGGPEPGEPGPEQKTFKLDFRLNGEDFTDVEDGNITVPDDFKMDEITEFYITKIVVTGKNGTETYNYNDNEYSYSLEDNEGRKILETNFEKISENCVNLRVMSHSSDIQANDKVNGRIYYDFYITGIKLVKSGFKGVETSTSVMPDNYDFTQWNGVDLSETTKANPGKVTAYYGEDTIQFDSNVASNIKKISLVSNSGVPSSAVSIDNTNKTVKVLSNYYNEIPLEIELEDGTKGYITVDRIGIFVDRLNAGNKVFYHGASADVGENMNVDVDKNRIVAVFYHEDTKTYNDYDLIVNMVFRDGSTKTAIAKGVGDVANSHGNIVGSDYILWASATEEEPVEIYVTAVSKDALKDANTFGGATFGSGEGVEWTNGFYER